MDADALPNDFVDVSKLKTLSDVLQGGGGGGGAFVGKIKTAVKLLQKFAAYVKDNYDTCKKPF